MGIAGGLLGAFIGKGDNRGKVLEALKRPVVSTATETFKYGRKGSANEGLVIEHTTKTKEISVGDILALTIAGGILYVASEGPFRDWLWNLFDPLGVLIPDPSESDAYKAIGIMEALKDTFKEAIDPLNLFE